MSYKLVIPDNVRLLWDTTFTINNSTFFNFAVVVDQQGVENIIISTDTPYWGEYFYLIDHGIERKASYRENNRYTVDWHGVAKGVHFITGCVPFKEGQV